MAIKSIKTKFILILLAISFFVISLIGLTSYIIFQSSLKKQLLNSLINIARSKEQAIIGLLTLTLQQMEILTTNGLIQDILQEWQKREQGEKIDEKRLYEKITSVFKIELVEFNSVTDFYDFVFIGKNGRVFYATNKSLIGANYSKNKKYLNGIKKSYLSDISYDSKSKRYFREVSVPVHSHTAHHEGGIGVIVGVIIAKVGTKLLNEITTNREGIGETGEVYVVNKNSFMITESRFIKDAILKQRVETLPVKLFQEEKRVISEMYPNYRNQLVAGASMGNKLSHRFPELGWTILAEVDASELLMPIFKLRDTILNISFMVFLFMILIAIIVANTMSSPIRSLINSARRVSGGDLSAYVPVRSEDEIGQLALTFNKMVMDLQKSFTSIDNLNTEIEVRNRAEESLRESEQQFVTVVDNINYGITLVNTRMEILAINKQLLSWFLIKNNPMKQHCYQVICRDSRVDKCPHCPTCKTLQDGQAYESFADMNLGGHIVNFKIRSYPVKDSSSKVVGAVEMFEDISSEREIEIARKEAMDLKSKFTSMVSHELRTPLGPIKEGVCIILDGLTGEINPEQRDLLDTVKRNAVRLNHLINNVLDFQKFESGKMKFNIEKNDIATAINDVYNMMKLVIRQKGLEFIVKIENSLPKFPFDKDKIVQVLLNLVNNAFKFTENGNITIEARRAESFIHVSVKDTGTGIKESDLPKLFATFSQLDIGKGKKIGGSGLGLAISKEIIQFHKGKIWAESEIDAGSVFQFTLPV